MVALGIGLWAVVRWQQTQPPDPGAISIEDITPPSTEWVRAEPEPWCDKAVPGLFAFGNSALSEPQLWEWYDTQFGPVITEPTARKNQSEHMTGSYRVYDDVSVWVRGSEVMVHTYDTVSHDCLSQAADPWDLQNAYSYEGLCAETNLVFWGDSYGKAQPEEPPTDWTVLTFDRGRRVAHGISDVSIVYAKEHDEDPWHRYDFGTECGID